MAALEAEQMMKQQIDNSHSQALKQQTTGRAANHRIESRSKLEERSHGFGLNGDVDEKGQASGLARQTPTSIWSGFVGLNKKVRISTYHKRKKGLMKKGNEFSILCGVETCMIIYGPKIKDNPAKLEIWPSDPAQVKTVINKYTEMPQDVHRKKCFNVYDYFASCQKKLYDEIYKLREANAYAKFPTWDDRLNNLSGDQFSALLTRLDSKIEAAKKKIEVMKGNLHQSLVEIDDSKPELFGTQPKFNLSNQAQLDIEVTCHKYPSTGLNPFDMNVPSYYPFSPSEALQVQPLTMLSTNSSDSFNQVDGESSSSITTYSSLSPQACYDQIASMLDNVPPFNSPWGLQPLCLYTLFVQPTTPFGQYTAATSSFPSHQFVVDEQHGPEKKKKWF